jgi:hypothetical protein
MTVEAARVSVPLADAELNARNATVKQRRLEGSDQGSADAVALHLWQQIDVQVRRGA